MNINGEKLMVFRRDGKYGAMYSIGLSKKEQNGEYTKGYIPVKFKKDVEIPNFTIINIKNGFLTFYKDKDGKTIYYPFILDFEIVETKTFTKQENKEEKDAFQQFGEEIHITEELLPF